ncbi:MAG: hypothetical protein ACQEVT_16775 [Pseudomonadota bacterium]
MHDTDTLLSECLTFVLDAEEIEGPDGEFTEVAEYAFTAIALRHVPRGRNDALGAAVDALWHWRYECVEIDRARSAELTKAVIDAVKQIDLKRAS